MSALSRYYRETLPLPRDPRTVEAGRALASFAVHADVQAVCEWRDANRVSSVKLACTDEDIATCLATLGE